MDESIKDIFEEYKEKKALIEMDIASMKEILAPYKDSIVLYGAGSSGIAFLYYLKSIGITPVLFADGNQKKWGTYCEGILIIKPEDIVKRVGKNALVIVCINTDGTIYCKSFEEELRKEGHTGVHRTLKAAGVKKTVDYTYFRRCYTLYRGDYYNLPSCSDVYLMEQHIQEIEKAYQLLSDEMSQKIYKSILRFRLLDDSVRVPTLSQEHQYFEQEIYTGGEEQVFVDCGAYNGISLRSFLLENKGRFSGYIGFEPDYENYKKLQEFLYDLPEDIRVKTCIYQYALAEAEGERCLYGLHGPGSFMAEIGKDKVTAVSLDKILEKRRVTYIKMNIEGAEKEALQGAKHIIQTQHPMLAIAGYHKTRDFWEIPLQIHSYDTSYRLILRSYMNHISFIYYAV